MREVKAYLDGFVDGINQMSQIIISELGKIQEELDNHYINKALQRVAESGMTITGLETEKDGRLLLVDYAAYEDVNFFTDDNGYINIVMKPTKAATNSAAKWGNNSEGLKEGIIKVEGE